MGYVVVKTTPEKDRFKSSVRHTYAAITTRQYRESHEWQDRLYCGVLSKKVATAMSQHLNRNTGQSFRWPK